MKKTLTIVLAFVLVIAMSVAGTVAYLTDSKTVTNTFSVGKVNLTLDEAPVKFKNDNGKYTWEAQGGSRVTTNEYDHLVPGAVLPKDPTIHVKAGSENCYVGAVIDIDKDLSSLMPFEGMLGYLEINQIAKGGLLDKKGTFMTEGYHGLNFVFQNEDAVIYQEKKADGAGHKLYVFMKAVQAPATDKDVDIKLFDRLELPGGWNATQLETFNNTHITINAYAVQASGFPDCYTAMKTGFSDVFPGTLPTTA